MKEPKKRLASSTSHALEMGTCYEHCLNLSCILVLNVMLTFEILTAHVTASVILDHKHCKQMKPKIKN
jgi:hypothetical protein